MAQEFVTTLGSGQGSSVLEVIRAFETASGKTIAYKIAPRRAGDISDYFADAELAATLLNWRTKRSLADMCRDAWCWQRQNPDGFVA
jgi:UDP-glucose 4-epimerase